MRKYGRQLGLHKYQNNPKRERKPGGGKIGVLRTYSDKLFFILLYYKCYPTYDVASFLYACDRSAACRRQQQLSTLLEKTLKRKLVLPKRQIRSVEDFLKAFPEAREVFIDGTERPIQRPKDKEKQKANYSGKKKRHTRKNIIISTRKKRIGFLSKTAEGKESDITVLRSTAHPRYIPPNVKTHVDLGFKGLDTEYPDHHFSIPQFYQKYMNVLIQMRIQGYEKLKIRDIKIMDILGKYNEEEKSKSDTGVSLQGYRIESSYDPETLKIIQWVMKYSGGLVKDEKQAGYVLIGFVAVVIIIALFLVEGGTTVKYAPVPVTGREFEDVNWPPVHSSPTPQR